jgi:tetratricopeptide (TPR) repeat protein
MFFNRLSLGFRIIANLPLLVLVVFGAVLFRAMVIQQKIDLIYRTMARQAVTEGDFDKARFLQTRLVSTRRKVDPKDKYDWAVIIARGGDLMTANALIDELAPDDVTGYHEAHRAKAIRLAQSVTAREHRAVDGESLEKNLKLLRHHLSRSGSEDPLLLCDLWAGYYFAIGQDSQALKKVVESASHDPQRWLMAAITSERYGDLNQRDLCYQKAEDYFASKVDADPIDYQSRLGLTKVFVDTDRIDAASDLLAEGLILTARAELRRAASDLRLFEMTTIESPLEEGHADSNRLLAEALELDPLNPRVYARFLKVYQEEKSGRHRTQLRESLQRQVAKGEAIAFSHFSLGAVYWLDGDWVNSIWHAEKAMEIAPELLHVANNVAWLESQRDGGDLARALNLINTIVEKEPKMLEYRDTKGMILMKLDRWEEALVELETVLPKSVGQTRKSLHERLALVYAALGQDSLAKMHEQEAAALEVVE